MTRRSILVALVLACLTLTLFFSLDEHLLKSALAEKGEGAGIQELPLAIQKIYLKGNKVHILIVRTGGGKIDPGDYSKIRMKVDPGGGKPLRQWSLGDVDRNKALGAAGGKIEFDTGIVLEKGETVKAILSFGKWEASKQEALSLTTATALDKTAPSKMMAQDKMPAAASHGKVTPRLDDSGGIRITLPSSGQSFKPGDRMNVNALFLRDVGSGRLELHLKRMSSNVDLSLQMTSFDPTSGRMAYEGIWPLPTTGLPSGSDYYILANHASGAWGISDSFTISAEGEGLIRVLKPQAGEGVTPGFRFTVDYQFARHVGEGTVNVELYMLDADGRHGRPVLTTTRRHRPTRADMPEPVYRFEWQLPSDSAVGRAFVLITHPEAWGKSSNFEIAWAREAVFPSDYAVVDIFKDRNDFKARIRATGGNMADSVPISVNGEIRREIIRPDTDTVIVIRPVDYGREGCGVTHEVTIDPENRFREENRANNTLRKFVPIEDPDGYATVVEDLDSRGRLLFPCEPPRYSSSLGIACISVRNCSSEPVTIRVNVQQVGWTNIRDPATYFIRDKTAHYFISWAGIAGPEPIPPGRSMQACVHAEDLGNINSTVVFNLSGDGISRWRHLTNPINVPVRFGNPGTIIDVNTGTRRTTCNYVDW